HANGSFVGTGGNDVPVTINVSTLMFWHAIQADYQASGAT
ncbi:MAG: hypothetical protein RL345_626, partial [Chloroflexota bacterium]